MTDSTGDWLAAAERQVRDDPSRIGALFPAVGRNVGRGAAEDEGRARLLESLAALPRTDLLDEVELLYRHGDAAERRGVLRALDRLDVGADALPLVRDGLRSNDVRLVESAVQEYAAQHLDDHAWRHAIVKCVFVGVPLASVARVDERADEDLARMLLALAHERIAAGRDVPEDVWRVVDRFPSLLAAHEIWTELESDVPARRAAAAAALGDRPNPAER